MAGKLKVAVLMGGRSAERLVSLSTGTQILKALDPAKYTAYALDTLSGTVSIQVEEMPAVYKKLYAPDVETGTVSVPLPTIEGVGTLLESDGSSPVTALAELNRVAPSDRPDVVFIALHGPGGEDGTVQGMLEVLGVPYTGSGVLASALAMDKAMTKRVLSTAHVLTPADIVVRRGENAAEAWAASKMSLPVIVKPSRQGSTFGVTVVGVDKTESGTSLEEALADALETAFRYDDTVLVEQMVFGAEITVPIIGNRDLTVLPIVEIVPASGFYDYESKYTPGATEEIVPARIPNDLAARAREIALACHRTVGCRGMSRTDMIVTPAGEIYTLEINTIPGMTPTSLLPRSAEAAGMSFPQLLDTLIALALEDYGR